MSPSRAPRRGDRRGQSEVIGTLLLVAIVVVAGASVGLFALGLVNLGGPTGELVVETRETDAGVVVEPQAVGQEAEIRVGGTPVGRITPDGTGDDIFVPAAPGERVTVVAAEDGRTVLFAETVSEGDAGDFVAYYTFTAGSGDTLVDRSASDNDGTLRGDPTWVNDSEGAALAFDGGDDHVTVDDLAATGTTNVTEFTVAAKYRITGGGDSPNAVQQVAEHATPRAGSNFEWFLETHVVVGTYDGSSMRLYVDGTRVGQQPLGEDVEMGDLVIGADSDRSSQFLEGRIYELRLYYTGMTDSEVRTLTAAVSDESSEAPALSAANTDDRPDSSGPSPADATPVLALVVPGLFAGKRRD
jgi:flagellin-like protein